jgi:hypothetical protein
MRISGMLIAFFALVLFQNCAQSDLTTKQLDDNGSQHLLPVLKNDLEQTIDLTCVDKNDCQSIAAGAMACGGPSRYYVFSSRTTDSSKVQALADQITNIESQSNRDTNAIGNCLFLEPPLLDCVQSQCSAIH